MRICFVASSPKTITVFMAPLIRALLEEGHTIAAVANTREVDLLRRQGLDVDFSYAPIERSASPIRDLRAVFELKQIFKAGGYDLVHSITSKVGVLAMQAAYFAGVPVRIHCFTGQSWAVRAGWKRQFLKAMDSLTAKLSTAALADSSSQKAFLEDEGVVRSGQVVVPGHGSISGVDCDRFKPDLRTRRAARSEFGLSEDDVLILFLARVRKSKGVPELLEAFRRIKDGLPSAHLAVVGPSEDDEVETLLAQCKIARLYRVNGFVQQHERYLVAADILCLPSHYEGFGSVVIEAAACGVPTVGAKVYGLTDAIVDGETGLLHAVGNVQDLTSKLTTLVKDAGSRVSMGERARERAIAHFSQGEVVRHYLDFYRSCGVTSSAGVPVCPSLSGRTGGMKMYVTGGNGFVGRHLLEALLGSSSDVQIIAVHRRDLSEFPVSHPRVTWIQRDIVTDDLSDHLVGVDCVFHLAAHVSFETDEATERALERVNVLGTRRVAEAALEEGVKKFVYISSIAAGEYALGSALVSEENGIPQTLYGKSKRRGEAEVVRLASEGLAYLTFRPTALFGEHHKGSVFELVRVMKRGRYLQIGKGQNSTNFLYVKDFVNVVIQGALSEIENETYVVNHAKHTLEELTAHISACLGQSEPRLYLPRAAGMTLGLVADCMRKLTRVDLPISVQRVRAICRDTYYSPDKLYAQGDFTETYGLEKGLANTIAWFRSSQLL